MIGVVRDRLAALALGRGRGRGLARGRAREAQPDFGAYLGSVVSREFMARYEARFGQLPEVWARRREAELREARRQRAIADGTYDA